MLVTHFIADKLSHVSGIHLLLENSPYVSNKHFLLLEPAICVTIIDFIAGQTVPCVRYAFTSGQTVLCVKYTFITGQIVLCVRYAFIGA